MKKIYFYYLLVLIGLNTAWANGPCISDIIISGLYSTTYTNFYSWIKTSDLTTISSFANVILDADPATDGNVLMDTGFETLPNSIFLAIMQTPCVLLGIEKNEISDYLDIFPNPTSDIINLKSFETILSTEIIDFNGRIFQSSIQNKNEVTINLETLSSGMYFLKIATNKGSSIQKIIKK